MTNTEKMIASIADFCFMLGRRGKYSKEETIGLFGDAIVSDLYDAICRLPEYLRQRQPAMTSTLLQFPFRRAICPALPLKLSNLHAWFESQLHGLRMMMLTMRMSFEEAVSCQLKLNPYFEEQWKRIIDTKYLEKQLIV